MSLKNWMKAIFPKPRLPQKRYVVLACLFLWVVLKIYTVCTPSTADDSLPDDFSTAAQIGLSADGVEESDYYDQGDDYNYEGAPLIVESGAYGEYN